MARVRVQMSSAGSRELLRSAEVAADIRRRADAVARAAGAGMEVEHGVTRHRARSVVLARTYRGRIREAKSKALTRAIDAGRA